MTFRNIETEGAVRAPVSRPPFRAPKFRAVGAQKADRKLVYRRHSFAIVHCTANTVIGARECWVMWHHEPNGPKGLEAMHSWPTVSPEIGLGCTGTFYSLADAERAVLAICATIVEPGANIVRFPVERRRAEARP